MSEPKPGWVMLLEPMVEEYTRFTADLRRFLHECSTDELEDLYQAFNRNSFKWGHEFHQVTQIARQMTKHELSTRRRRKRRDAPHIARVTVDHGANQFVATCDCGWAKRFDMRLHNKDAVQFEVNVHLGMKTAPLAGFKVGQIAPMPRQAGKFSLALDSQPEIYEL